MIHQDVVSFFVCLRAKNVMAGILFTRHRVSALQTGQIFFEVKNNWSVLHDAKGNCSDLHAHYLTEGLELSHHVVSENGRSLLFVWAL